MKALVCGSCADIRALPCIAPLRAWVRCRCGNAEGRWVEPDRGVAEFRAFDRTHAFVLGLNNAFFNPALQGKLKLFEDMRACHAAATLAPGFVFDREKAACWAVVFTIGATSDTSWADGLPGDPEPSP